MSVALLPPPISPSTPPVNLTGQGRDGTETAAQTIAACVPAAPIVRGDTRTMDEAEASVAAVVVAVFARTPRYALAGHLWSLSYLMTDEEIEATLPLLLEYCAGGSKNPKPEVAASYAQSARDFLIRADRAAFIRSVTP